MGRELNFLLVVGGFILLIVITLFAAGVIAPEKPAEGGGETTVTQLFLSGLLGGGKPDDLDAFCREATSFSTPQEASDWLGPRRVSELRYLLACLLARQDGPEADGVWK